MATDTEEFRKFLSRARKRCRLSKDLRRRHIYILADPWHRDNLCNQKTRTKQKLANPGEGKESDIQSYHSIMFECPVFKKKKKLQGM